MNKFSRKREAIFEYIRASREHPSAEKVYDDLRPVFPGLSLATVYRNISEFKKLAMVQSVGTVMGHERFDADLSSHAHFICLNCGTVLDVNMELDTAELMMNVSKDTGALVEEISLTLSGHCPQCRAKREGRVR